MEGMRDRVALDAWEPSLPDFALLASMPGQVVTVKILQVCSGCNSVSCAATREI